MEAGKGYSVTMSPPPLPITRPLYLGDTRVGVSPLAGAVRIGGTMELSGLNYRLDPRRVAALTTAVQSYLDGWQTTTVEETWTGMRPLTPDGLPVIGTVPAARNVVLATGHAMLGVTLGPATGEVVADLVTTDARLPMLAAFSPTRFRQ
jgi:D-amino-acid dehydrogenase